MNKVARGALFWTFITFFLVAAPISVLYTAGFRYNPKNGSLVRTGVISTSTNPRNAEILLDGIPTEKTTPFVLKRILPGEYQLAFQKEEFHPWSGTVDVQSGGTTNIHNVLLYRKEQPHQEFLKLAVELAPNPNNELIAYTIKEGGWEEIWLFNTEETEPQLIHRVNKDLDTELTWSANGSRLLAQDENTASVRLFLDNGREISLPAETIKDAEEVYWHPNEDNLIYISTANELREFNFATQQTVLFDNTPLPEISIDGNQLTFIDNGTDIELYKVNTNKELLAVIPRATYQVLEYDAPFLLLQDTRKNLVLLNIESTQPILLETTAHVYDWDQENDRLVFSDGIEVSTYTPSSHTTEFITRQSVFIESVAWHAEGERILVTTRNNISAIETHRVAEKRQTTNILQAQQIDTYWISQNEKTLYFYGTLEGATGFYSLELLR